MKKGVSGKSIVGLIVFMLLLSFQTLRATHLRAGEITVTQNCPSRTFTICVNLYVNTNPSTTTVKPFMGGTIDFGDGTFFQTKEVTPTPFGDASDFVGFAKICLSHTYPAPGLYKVTYSESNRNAGILNMSNSVNTSFFIETTFDIDPFKGCNNSPRLLVPPIDKACSGATWFHNPGAYDIDGDSLSYKIITPRQSLGNGVVEVVGNYTLPNNQTHYSGFDYNHANEAKSDKPTFAMDPYDGTVVWDAPGQPGQYNIAFVVTEWRKINDVWVVMGSIVRDMQIFVEDCPNKRPELIVPIDTCVVAGALIQVPIYGKDPDFDDVIIEAFSEALILNISPATYSPKDVFQKTTPQPAKITFTWQTDCAHIKQQPYKVVFKITDKPKNGGVKLASFATWNITVVGPPPDWTSATIGSNRSGQLQWNSYSCSSKADSMQIWRRIDSVPYDRQNCVTGMPASLGYEKIETVGIGQTSYIDTNRDKGLPPGAVVCYRLVATFPALLGNTFGGTESLVSDEICVGPIPVDAPVMTNVTVDVTNRTNGQITVRWTPPFDVDSAQFPSPFHYNVYRANGFSGDSGLTLVGTTLQTDTFLVDTNLNTADNVYNYRVMAYDSTATLIDTSAIASSVRLQAKSLVEKIELTWTADVPWSLRSAISPYHVIYRGSEGQVESQFVQIATIEPTIGLLRYTDDGSWNGESLIKNQSYCYRVETRGSYGYNDTSKIPDPLINFSQIICAKSSDVDPPCSPILSLDLLSCEDYYKRYGCSFNDFSNTLVWSRPQDKECRDDISHYRVYYSTKLNGVDSVDYKLLVDLSDHPLDTSYVDRNLPSFARCYKLSAVDHSGNESAWSDEVCNDNCPNYNLPNFFTPGNNDNCNDLFSAYSDRTFINDISLCLDEKISDKFKIKIQELCPRFVLRVDVKIVDRWGKEVYSYTSGGENNIYIDWDGRDQNGKELSAGVYYYSARITFDTLDPKDSERIIKGWVHLVRPQY